jgi:hypothetical protein
MVKYIRFTKEEDEYLQKRVSIPAHDAVHSFCMKFGNLHSQASIYRRFNEFRFYGRTCISSADWTYAEKQFVLRNIEKPAGALFNLFDKQPGFSKRTKQQISDFRRLLKKAR